MLVSNGSGEHQVQVSEQIAQETPAKGEKGELSYKEMAARNVTRARKALGEENAEKPMISDHLMQSAIVFAILDLADAVRSNPQGLSG
jgi:hypothetical protein